MKTNQLFRILYSGLILGFFFLLLSVSYPSVSVKAASCDTSCAGCGVNYECHGGTDCSCACQMPPNNTCVDPGCHASCATDSTGCPSGCNYSCNGCSGNGGGGGGGGSGSYNGIVLATDTGSNRWSNGAVDCANHIGVSVSSSSGGVGWQSDSFGGHFDVTGVATGNITATLTLPAGCGYDCSTTKWMVNDYGSPQTTYETGTGCSANFNFPGGSFTRGIIFTMNVCNGWNNFDQPLDKAVLIAGSTVNLFGWDWFCNAPVPYQGGTLDLHFCDANGNNCNYIGAASRNARNIPLGNCSVFPGADPTRPRSTDLSNIGWIYYSWKVPNSPGDYIIKSAAINDSVGWAAGTNKCIKWKEKPITIVIPTPTTTLTPTPTSSPTPTTPPTPTITATPTPKPYFQVFGGDVHVLNNDILNTPLSNILPLNKYFLNNIKTPVPEPSSAGIFSTKSTSANSLGLGFLSERNPNDWLAVDEFPTNASGKIIYDYSYFKASYVTKAINIHDPAGHNCSNISLQISNSTLTSASCNIDLSANQDKIWEINGNIIINSLAQNLSSQVFIINGTVTVNNDITGLNHTTFPVFISSDKIIINPNVRFINGVFITDSSFESGNSTNPLTLESGSVMALGTGSSFNLQRQNAVSADPSEIFNFDPIYLIRLSNLLGKYYTIWQEVAP